MNVIGPRGGSEGWTGPESAYQDCLGGRWKPGGRGDAPSHSLVDKWEKSNRSAGLEVERVR